MGSINRLKQDTSLEVEGIWVTYPGTDVRFKIARAGHPEMENAIATSHRSERLRRALNGERVSNEEARRAFAPIIAKHILRGWENLEDENGDTLVFSEQSALDLLLSEGMHDLYDWVLRISQDVARYRVQENDEDMGKFKSV